MFSERKKYKHITIIVISSLLFVSATSFEFDTQYLKARLLNSELNIRIFDSKNDEHKAITKQYLLDSSSILKIKSNPKWSKITRVISKGIKNIHNEYNSLLGLTSQGMVISIKLMEPKNFYAIPQVPEWTNAVFFRGEIVLPINKNSLHRDLDGILRSIRHEYIHALINFRSDNRCPGWIDEGLAQIAEGTPHPSLGRTLKKWLISHSLINFSELQGGFTEISREKVAPAYAQSLLATKLLIDRASYKAFGEYFYLLKNKFSSKNAFKRAFRIEERQFYNLLEKEIYENRLLSNIAGIIHEGRSEGL